MAEANTTSKKVDPTRITLGSVDHPVRFSYAWVHEPKIDDKKIDKKTNEPERKYQAMILIPKADKTAKPMIEAAVRAAADTKVPGKEIPRAWSIPLRDGDEECDEKGDVVKGHWFLNCSSKRKPDIAGTKKNDSGKLVRLGQEEMIDGNPVFFEKLKSGDYGRVTLNFYYFENETKGIAVGLNNIQLLKVGESLGGTSSADSDFDDDIEDGFAD